MIVPNVARAVTRSVPEWALTMCASSLARGDIERIVQFYKNK